MKVIIEAYGHKNIRATHKTTIEITKDKNLSLRGDCIIGVKSSYSCNELPNNLKENLKNGGKFKVTLKVSNETDEILGFGSEKLILKNKKEIVLRKSSYIDDRTLLVRCNKAAIDIKREIVELLKRGKKLEFIIEKV